MQGTGLDVEIDPDRRTAIHRAIGAAEPGDVVVIAGKGHEQGQEVAGTVHPFDDRAVAREALAALRVPLTSCGRIDADLRRAQPGIRPGPEERWGMAVGAMA